LFSGDGLRRDCVGANAASIRAGDSVGGNEMARLDLGERCNHRLVADGAYRAGHLV
jgi:hypothetical protein